MNGSNVITKAICEDKEKLIELGKIKVAIMNRFLYKLDTDVWNIERVSSSRAVAKAQPSHARKFIDTVSLITWENAVSCPSQIR